MKKVFVIALCALMALSLLCGCQDANQKTPQPETGLQVGWGRVDVTPEFPVPMAGYGTYDDRMSRGYIDYLYVTCLAFSDGTETVLVYTMDAINATAGSMPVEYRAAITEATGIPSEQIFLGATHTHSGGGITNSEAGKAYKKMMLEAVAEAGAEAMADLGPCTMSVAKANLEKMNFVRHFKLEDGNYMGSNFNEDSTSPIVGYVTEPDNQMILLNFAREGKQDIVLVNWQAHPDHASQNGYYMLSSDFVGAMRSTMEDELNVLMAYYTGAAGNVNPFTPIKEDNHGLTMPQYGQKLAEHAIKLMDSLQPVEDTTIKHTTRVHTFTIDHSWDHMIVQAREIQSINNKEGRDAATKAGLKYGFSSAYHANAIISRISKGATEDRVLGAFRIGSVGFIEAKCEMFSDTSIYIKENSPFDTTVVICGHGMYIPSDAAYDYHAYEADTATYARGSAEDMAQAFVEMLNSLK